ncbi:sporulation-induced protein, partial [Oleoguttula sp. CCFEE 5521]
MFWRFGGYASISTLDTILDKPDVTVEDLLEESDLIQELKQQNSKLVEFLRDEPILEKLLTYVTADQPPISLKREGSGDSAGKDGEEKTTTSTGISFFGRGKSRSRSKSISKRDGDGETEHDKQEAQRKKFAYVACEVLSSEVWSITEAVLEHRAHLKEFWQYMHRPAPLDPLQAGYFTKVNEALLDKKTEDMLTFIKSLDGIVPAMLQHVDCPMVMDLLLKIISLEKHEGGAGIVDWLQMQNLIPLLLEYLSPEHSSATQTSAGDFLKAIITISANATTQDTSVIGPNELTRQLVSEKCIKTLIDDMLRGGNALTVGVGIIIEVIRKNNSDYDLDNQVGPEPKTSDPIFLGTLLRQFAHHVPDFMHLIRSKSARKPDLKAASGGKVEPLGFDRFKTCELMAELLHCSNMGLLNERGAEEEVARRDIERERLKAEGKLATPRAPASPSHLNDQDEFGSSVDSHGFHHAEKPAINDLDEAPEEIKKLEVQNASDEDGFEKVAAPASDDLPDEVSFDDFNEKIENSE